MKKEKVVHAHIDCQVCNKIIIQYLGEPMVFEIIKNENGSTLDACIDCADKYYTTKNRP